MISQKLEAMRGALYAAPGFESWRSICDLIDACEPGEELETVVRYTDSHLERWPDELRQAPSRWLKDLLKGGDDPRFDLVRRLDLAGDGFGKEEIAALAAQPALSRVSMLVIHGVKIKREGLTKIMGSPVFQNLRRLSLLERLLVPRDLAELFRRGPLESLESLSLGGVFFNDSLVAAIAEIDDFRPLVALCVSASINDADISALADLPLLESLESLELTSCRFQDATALMVSERLSKLRRLNLGHNALELNSQCARALKESEALSNLTDLGLSGCRLGSDGLAALSHSRSLRPARLDLSCVGATSDGLEVLARSQVMSSVKDLDVYGNPLGAKGIEALDVPTLAGLTALKLGSCELGDGGIDALIASAERPELKALELSGNALTSEGAKRLASWSGLRRIESLALWGNAIDDDGIEALARSPFVAGLGSLELWGNAFGERGERALRESVHLGQIVKDKLAAQRAIEEG